MNEYEERKQRRIERYEELAQKNEAKSIEESKYSSDLLEPIPFGQPNINGALTPILKKSENAMRRSIAASEKAEYYKDKAEAAKYNTAISSDDPEALQKLKDKVEKRKAAHKDMVAMNRYYRKHGTCKGYKDLSDEEAQKIDNKIDKDYSWNKQPYPSYTLTNDNQDIKRLEQRIKGLELRDNFVGWEFDGGKVVANTEENRLQVYFDEKPDEEKRSQLKAHGFKYSRRNNHAWQRMLNTKSYYSASYVDCIKPLSGEKPYELMRKNLAKPKEKSKDMSL